MKLPLCAALTLSILSASAFAANEQTQNMAQLNPAAGNATQIELKTEMDKLSYTVGADLGRNFKKQDITINTDALIRGLNDGQAGQKLLMSKEAMENTLKAFQKKMLAKRIDKFKSAADKNKAEGDAFLAKNKQQKDVVVLPSGLQYRIVTAGTGPKPADTDTVKVAYTGKLINGTVFDSTEKTGKPASFKVTEVIPGWTEALKLMPEGSTWEIFVPSNLAYGPRGVGEPIGPNETLIFKIQLLSIEKGSKASAGQKKNNS